MYKKIAIHSAPRSGSTWLGSIFDSCPNVAYRYQPLFSYAFKGILNERSTKRDIDDFFDKIMNSNDAFINQTEAKQNELIPIFKKQKIASIVYKEVRYHYILENILKKDKEVKIIGLVRNPLSVINSWLKAPKEFRRDLNWDISEWRYALLKNQDKPEEYNGFQKWKELTELFIKLEQSHPENFKILEYKDLISNKETTVKEIFKFCNLEYTDQTRNFLNNKDSNDNNYSVFKVKNHDRAFENELPKNIQIEITTELEGTKLSRFL